MDTFYNKDPARKRYTRTPDIQLTHHQGETIDALIEEHAIKDGRHLSRIEQVSRQA